MSSTTGSLNHLTILQHNDIVVLMIPELIDIGGPWKVLPPGVYDSSFEEVEKYYVTNEKRRKLFQGLLRACKSLKSGGCSTIYLDGSYITDNPIPSDYDVCWNSYHVDDKKIDPVFLDFSEKRKRQKLKYGGEFFPTSYLADGVHLFIQYFQTDKETGLDKGIIRLQL